MKQDSSGRRDLAAPFQFFASVKMIIIYHCYYFIIQQEKDFKQIDSPIPIRGGASAVLLPNERIIVLICDKQYYFRTPQQ